MAGAVDVAVTGPNRRLKVSWWATRLMLRLAGLRAVYRMPGTGAGPALVRGIVVGGGDNIEPAHYGAVGDGLAEYDVQRDQFEIDILRRALATAVPVLGICRGAQLINVVLGGTLYQDLRPLRRRTPNANSAFPVKYVDLAAGSRLAAQLSVRRIRVNSLHHQAVERVADRLQVAARDSDAFIQAIEGPPERFLVGVQWHPEYLPYQHAQRALFRAFAESVRRCEARISI